MLILKQARNIVALTFVILAVVLLLPVGLSWAETVLERQLACMKVCSANYSACNADVASAFDQVDDAAGHRKAIESCQKLYSDCVKKCNTIE